MTILMWFHSALAVAALGLGPLVLLRTKGTRSHRWFGFGYAATMLMVALSGVAVTLELGRGSPFLVFSAMVLISIPAGLWAIWQAGASRTRRHLEGHYYAMSWSYAGLLLALGSQAFLTATKLGLLTSSRLNFFIFLGLMVAGNLVARQIIERLRNPVLGRYLATRPTESAPTPVPGSASLRHH